MRFASCRQWNTLLAPAICAVILATCLAVINPSVTQAQSTQYDQNYGSGTYGQSDFGGTTKPVSSPTVTTTPTPTPTSDGLSGIFPNTGADMILWTAIGALLLAAGAGLYGYSRRTHRRQSKGDA